MSYVTDYHTLTPKGRTTQGRFRSDSATMARHIALWASSGIMSLGPVCHWEVGGPGDPFPGLSPREAAPLPRSAEPTGAPCTRCRGTDTFEAGFGQLYHFCRTCRTQFFPRTG